MPALTTGFGAFLMLLGLAGYLVSGRASVTALIPSFIGVLLVAFGLLARRETMRKHAMHGASLLALLGVLGSARGVVLWAAGRSVSPLATISQLLLFVTCGVFLALCVRSFVSARRQRSARVG